MAIDERTRHEMYLGLEEKLGSTVADAPMAHLPPAGWADLATRHDLAALEERIELRFQRQDEHIDARIHAEVNRLLLFLFPTLLSGLGLAALLGKVV